MADEAGAVSTASDNTPTLNSPVSAHEALALADSSSAEASPTPDPAPESTPVAASQPPDAAESSPETPPAATVAPGPVPYDRFAEVTRQKKQLAEKLKQFDTLEGLSPSEVAAVANWTKQLRSNPAAAYRELQQTLLAIDPTVAAQMLPKPAEAPKADADPMPDADLQAEDGTLVYSAVQMRKVQEWQARQLKQQMLSEFQQQIKPLEQVAETVRSERAQAQAWTEVSTLLSEFRADPKFTAHETDIRQMLLDDQRLAALADADPRMAVELAYGRVYREKIAPMQVAQTQQQVVNDLRQRAAANTANPSQPRASVPASTIGDARAALALAMADAN